MHILKTKSDAAALFREENGETCQRYSVDAFPSYVLIGTEGSVVMTTKEDREVLAGHLVETVRQFLNAAKLLDRSTPSGTP